MVLVCLFYASTVVLADSDILAPLAGNPKVYKEMHNLMEERLASHQEPIDEFIKQNSGRAKSLSAIPYLEEEFMRSINACGANSMLTRLKTTLASAGGKVQIIFVKNENELPIFDGQKAWGHAGTYVTVFALESEKDSKEGRKKIIGRLLHEIRARSTRAKELFDEEFKGQKLTTEEEIIAFIISMRERFEKDNLQIQQQIEQSNNITNQSLANEFASLTFAMHPDVMNRDYAMAQEPQNTGSLALELEELIAHKTSSDLWRLALKDGKTHPDYKDILDILIKELSNDFVFTEAEISETRREAEALKAISSDVIWGILRNRLHLGNRRLIRRRSQEDIQPEKYVIALGILFKEGRESPKAKPFIENIIQGIFRDSNFENNLMLTKPSQSYRIRGDRSTASWPMAYLYKSNDSIFAKTTRLGEGRLVESQAPGAKEKIDKALGIIEWWVAKRKADGLTDELNTFVDKIGWLKSLITIVEVDSPMPILFVDSQNQVARPIGIGRSRLVVYIPKLFLQDFDLDSPEDMNELAANLLHRLEWNYKNYVLMEEKKDEATIHAILGNHSQQFTQTNRYGLIAPEKIRKRLSRLVSLSLAVESMTLMPKILDLYSEIQKDIYTMERNYPDVYTPTVAIRDSRMPLREIEKKLRLLGGYFDILGAQDVSNVFFAESVNCIRLIQKNDSGVLPVGLQWDLVISDLREGNTDKFLENLRMFLTGENFPISPELSQTGAQEQLEFLKISAMFVIGDFRREIDRVFRSLLSIESDEAKRSVIRDAHSKAIALIDAFEKKQQGVRPAKERNAEILGLDLAKVEELTKKNAKTNYGATVVAGHPITGTSGNILTRWREEILAVTNGKFRINSDFSHATVGAMLRSQDQPVKEENLSKVDFEKVIQAIEMAQGYKIHFKKVAFSDGCEGNIILVGEVEGGGLSHLQKSFMEAGFDLKWKVPEAGKAAKVFVTLGQINVNTLSALNEEETQNLKQWVKEHSEIKEPMIFEVNEVRLALYTQRMLEFTVAPDIHFVLGSKSSISKDELKQAILNAFNHHSRFENLKQCSWYGILTDIDYSLTDENRIVPDEAISNIAKKLKGRVRIGFTTSRAYEINPSLRRFNASGKQVGGARDVKEVVDRIRAALGVDQWALNYIDVFPEDSSYGFNVGNPNIIYDFGASSPVGSAESQQAFYQTIFPILNDYYRDKYQVRYQDLAAIIFKSRTITVQIPRANEVGLDKVFISHLESQILSFFTSRKIEVEFSWSGESIEIKPKGANKGLSIQKFGELLEGKPFITLDDQGQTGGNGEILINREGGISLDRFDTDNPHVVAASLLSGQKGVGAWLFAVNQLKFLASNESARLTPQTRSREKLPSEVMEKLATAMPVMKKTMLDVGMIINKWRVQANVKVKYKPGQESANQSVVTEADFEVQTYILDQLEKQLGFPFRVIAEETEGNLGKRIESINQRNHNSPFEIVIDPIDGTRQFINPASNYFGSVLSLIYHGDVIAAFFIAPEQVISGKKGAIFEASELENGFFVSEIREGAAFNRKQISFDQSENNFNGRTVLVYRDITGSLNIEGLKLDRIGKSSGMALSMVAMGGRENPMAYVDAKRPIWDVSAGAYFVEKSGGVAVKINGENILPFRSETLKDNQVLEIVAGHPKVVGQLLPGTQSLATAVRKAVEILPQEWHENNSKVADFVAELLHLLQIENVIEQDKATFIFSEQVTFDNGLGVLLPKLVKSGMRVAVIATNDRQRALIDELNQGKPENERIFYADTIADIRTKVHTARYYYFKVNGDPVTDLQGVTTFDITEIVKKIIDALGKVCGIVERERIELLHEAAHKFAEAA